MYFSFNDIKELLIVIVGAAVGAFGSYWGSSWLYRRGIKKQKADFAKDELNQYIFILRDTASRLRIEIRNQIVIAVSAFNHRDIFISRNPLYRQVIEEWFRMTNVKVNVSILRDIQIYNEQGEFVNKLIQEHTNIRNWYRHQDQQSLSRDRKETTEINISMLETNILYHTKYTLPDLLGLYSRVVKELSNYKCTEERVLDESFYQEVFSVEFSSYKALKFFGNDSVEQFNKDVGFNFVLPNPQEEHV